MVEIGMGVPVVGLRVSISLYEIQCHDDYHWKSD